MHQFASTKDVLPWLNNNGQYFTNSEFFRLPRNEQIILIYNILHFAQVLTQQNNLDLTLNNLQKIELIDPRISKTAQDKITSDVGIFTNPPFPDSLHHGNLTLLHQLAACLIGAGKVDLNGDKGFAFEKASLKMIRYNEAGPPIFFRVCPADLYSHKMFRVDLEKQKVNPQLYKVGDISKALKRADDGEILQKDQINRILKLITLNGYTEKKISYAWRNALTVVFNANHQIEVDTRHYFRLKTGEKMVIGGLFSHSPDPHVHFQKPGSGNIHIEIAHK